MIKKAKFAPKNVLKLHKDTIIGLHSPGGASGAMLYSCSKEGCVRILDLTEKKIFNTILLSKTGPQVEEKGVDMNADMSEIQRITLEAIENKGVPEDITAVLFAENTVYGGYENGDVYCWNLKSGEVIYAMPGHTKNIKQLIQLNPRIVASSSADKTIRCWDTTSGTCESIIKLDGAINQMVKDGKFLYVLLEHGMIAVINTDNYHLVDSLSLDSMIVFRFLVKDNIFYLAHSNNKISVFELKENIFEPKYELQGHKDWIHCLKILDGFLYTGSDDRTVKVWDLTAQTMVDEFTDHDDGVLCLEFCDKSVYSGSFDHTIRFWKIEEIHWRILDRKRMAREDLASRKYEAYCKVMFKGKKGKAASKGPIKKR